MKTEQDPLRILAVEDEVLVRRFLDRTLQRMGHRVVGVVATSEDCIKTVKEQKVDLILMDIKIKGPVDGIETADIIHREYEIPVIFLTAHADVATVERAAKTRPYGYIVKPFTEKDLRGAIAIALSRASVDKINDRLEIGHGYSYVPAKRQLFRGKELVSLTKKEQLLLHQLVLNQGEPVFYKTITDFVWSLDEFKSPNALRDLVYRLRKKVPEHNIKSTPGVGVELAKPPGK